jgi:hypothetical protein
VPGVSEAHLDELLKEEAVDNNPLMVSLHAAETVLSSGNICIEDCRTGTQTVSDDTH